MKRSLLLALPLSLLAAPAALALESDRTYDLHIEGTPVGTMSLRARVTDDGAGHCQYTGGWTSPNLGLARTRLCRLSEYKASDNFDCEANRRTFFSTIVSVPQGGCAGFDEWGQATDVPSLIAGESPRGDLYGIVVVANVGDVQSFGMLARRLQPVVPSNPRTLQPRLPIEKMPIQVIP
jgi:hypothetical protein